MRLLGLDPGLRNTGWGLIDVRGNRLSHVAHGVVRPALDRGLAERLLMIVEGLSAVIADYLPDQAAVEETFVNKNPNSTLKLGMARGVVLFAPAQAGLPVAEYPPNLVKKSVVGAGHADKDQVRMMVKTILPGVGALTLDASDALAVAICHAHHAATRERVSARAHAGVAP